MSGYCLIAPGHPVHDYYHSNEYGFPQRDERELFERLVLEINQAGLSWETILKKREGFRAAYDGFDVDRVAAYAEQDIERLLSDAGIIRNRLKVLAAIHNAQVIQQLRASHGSFAAWLDAHHPRSKADWVKLFKKTFRFRLGEAVQEDVPLHRRRDHRRIPDEPGLPARCARRGLPGACAAADAVAAVVEGCRPLMDIRRAWPGAAMHGFR